MRIATLYRYPIKSMGGEELQSAQVLQSGIVGDRRFAILDVTTGKIASAKNPKKWASLLRFSAKYVAEPTASKPLPAVYIKFPDRTVRRSDSAGINDHLSRALGQHVRLIVNSPPNASSELMWRVVKEQEATDWTRQRTVGVKDGQDVVVFALAERVPRIEGQDSFQDWAPLHLITTSTLRKLEDLTPGVKFDHRRYRPNILLEATGSGFVEQSWDGKSLWLGKVGMYVLAPTPRCVMSTLGHGGLPADRRTLRAITRYNSLELQQLPGKWGCAGIYLSPFTAGRIDVDCSVSIADASSEVIAQMQPIIAELPELRPGFETSRQSRKGT